MKLSRKMTFLSALAGFFVAAILMSPAATAQTELKVYNATNTEVDVWWNGTNPAANNIRVKSGNTDLPVSIPPIFTNSGKGVFVLSAGATATISRVQGGSVLNGTLTFNCIPVCPCGVPGRNPCDQIDGFHLPKKLPNGSNQAEFALNTGFESIDISCVNGANCRLEMATEGGSPPWANNVTHQPVSKIANKMVDVAAGRDENCAEVGVFPFNATDCIQTPNPPCGQPICFHAVRDCQLDRQGSGGSVTVVIGGFDAL